MDFREANQSFDVEFKKNGALIRFRIFHNLPEMRGLDPESALINWMYRTDTHTAKSFCNYIRSKDRCFMAFTESQFNKLLKANGLKCSPMKTNN